MSKTKPHPKERSERAKARSPGPGLKKTGEWQPRFFNHLTFTWNSQIHRWEAEGPGLPPNNPMHWWVGVTTLECQFQHRILEEFGVVRNWCTVKHAEEMIEDCCEYPVFSQNPSTMFLRRWLDSWVETNYARYWRHIFDFLRLKCGVKEADADKRASAICAEYEAIFSKPNASTTEEKPVTVPQKPPEEKTPPPTQTYPEPLAQVIPPGVRLGLGVPLNFARTFGLTRNRSQDTRWRDLLEKFEKGGNLNDKELRVLLQFFGSLYRMTELLGPRYYLANRDIENQYASLLELARERNWSQALIKMIGSMSNRTFEIIC